MIKGVNKNNIQIIYMLEEELENLDEIGIKLARLEDIIKHRDDLDVSLCKENI